MPTAVKMGRVSKVSNTAEVVEWLKQPGQAVREGEPLLRVLSEKATVDVEAPAGGALLAILVPAGREVAVGTLLGWIGQAGEALPAAEAPQVAAPSAPAKAAAAPLPAPVATRPAAPAGPLRAVPAARRLAAERGIDLAGLAGSGPDGLITVADVESAQKAEPAPAPLAEPAAPIAELPLAPGERAEPLTGIQRVMLERMTSNVREVAQATTVAEVDVTDVMGLRGNVPATLTAWVVLAAARALGEYPMLNASLRGKELVYHAGADVGVSVETDAGLLVPVIRDAQRLTLSQVNGTLQRLVEAARAGRLAPEEMAGATFTVTNSGVLGSVLYTPMIVPPQSAILGMGRAAKTPVMRDDQMVVRTLMYLCLSYDHRFIAGGTAVRYLQRVRAYLEHPVALVWDAGAPSV